MKLALVFIFIINHSNINFDAVIDVITESDDILYNDVNLIQIENDLFIVSVGTAVIDDVINKQGKTEAITIATLKAQSAISKFVNSSFVTVEERLTKTTTFLKTATSSVNMSEKEFETLIRERSRGELNNIREIKKWKIENVQYVALVLAL